MEEPANNSAIDQHLRKLGPVTAENLRSSTSELHLSRATYLCSRNSLVNGDVSFLAREFSRHIWAVLDYGQRSRTSFLEKG